MAKKKKSSKSKKKPAKKKRTAKKRKKPAKNKASKKKGKKAAKKKAKKSTKPKAKGKRSRKPSNKKSSRAAPKGKTKRGRRYSARRQAALLDKYHELRKGGLNADKAAKTVGVSYLTLLKWEKKTGKKIKSKRGRPPGKKSALKKALRTPKKGRPSKAKQEGLTLVTPTGFRIEGITTKELIKVLKSMK